MTGQQTHRDFYSLIFYLPAEVGLAPEHGSELLRDAHEQLLNGCAVSDEGGRHLEVRGRDVTDSCLNIVWDLLHKVAAVLVLRIHHLPIHILHGHAASEDGGGCKVATHDVSRKLK